MKTAEPIWYEALRGDPHQVPTFTNELKARIKVQAHSWPAQKKPHLRRVAIIGIGLISMVGFILFATRDVNPLDTNSMSGLRAFSDSQYLEQMDEKYTSTHNEILFKKKISDERMLVINKKLYEVNELHIIVFGAELLEWGSAGWDSKTHQRNPAQWHLTYSYSMGDFKNPWNEERVKIYWSGWGFVGAIIDPQISRLEVIDEQDIEYPVNMIENLEGYNFWYYMPSVLSDSYRLEGLDEEGNVIFTEYFY